HVGIAHQSDIGQQLEFQPKDFFFSGKTLLVLTRRLVRAGGKVLIAASAAPAVRHHHALVRLREIVQALAGLFVIHNSADRDLEHHAFAVAPGAVGAFAVTSALTLVLRVETEVDQRIVALARFQADVAATAAVAAGRAAARDKLLPAKGHASIATVAGLDANDRFINKHACI